MCSSRKNPYPPHGKSWKFLWGGVLKVKILEAKYEAELEFPGGGGVGDAKQKPFNGGGGGMDIFWNCTLINKYFYFLVKDANETMQ